MDLREIVTLAIFIIFVVPSLSGAIRWSIESSNDLSDLSNVGEGTEIVVGLTAPWWLGLFNWLGHLPVVLSAFSVVALVLFLKWKGEI